MAYTILDRITLLCADAQPSGTIPAADWQNNSIWQGSLFLPHETGLDQWPSAQNKAAVLLGSGTAPTPTEYYSQLLTFCPDFNLLNAAVNCDASDGDSVLSPMFRGFIRSMDGVSGARLSIVTREGSSLAYVYYLEDDAPGIAFSANILPNGDLQIHDSIRLSMPRLHSGSTCRYAGCLISGGLNSSGLADALIDCQVNTGQTSLSEGTGRRTSARFMVYPETWEATIEFLNQWLLEEKVIPNPSCFLKGFYTGSRLRTGGTIPSAPSLNETTAGGRTAYDEKSFLAGLAAGRRVTLPSGAGAAENTL